LYTELSIIQRFTHEFRVNTHKFNVAGDLLCTTRGILY
jgi:hypothetical protein